jgi:WD40 repeat protein
VKRLLLVLLSGLMLAVGLPVTSQDIEITPESVFALAWSPDSDQIAIGRRNGVVEILNAQTGQLIQSLFVVGDEAPVISLAWSPDGSHLAGTTRNPGVYIWDMNTGQLVHDLSSSVENTVHSLDWHADSIRLVGISQQGGVTHIWDTITGVKLLGRSSAGLYELNATVWHGDDLLRAFADLVSLITSTGDYVRSIGNAEHHYVTELSANPANNLVAGGSLDRSVYVWDVEQSELLHKLEGHTGIVGSVDWHPDGVRLASASYDGTVRVWNGLSGELLEVIEAPGLVGRVRWSPDGEHLAYVGIFGTADPAQIIPAPGMNIDISKER